MGGQTETIRKVDVAVSSLGSAVSAPPRRFLRSSHFYRLRDFIFWIRTMGMEGSLTSCEIENSLLIRLLVDG